MFCKCSSFLFTFFLFLITSNILTNNLHTEMPHAYVTAGFEGQLGNNLFQIATASALAWDHDADPIFPELATIQHTNFPINRKHLLYKCNSKPLLTEPTSHWKEISCAYHPIPYAPNMKIYGFFQSEKYFKHHRDRLLKLFSLTRKDRHYINKKYRKLLDRLLTVGIHVRWYNEHPSVTTFIQYGSDYLKKAIRLFPKETTFIVVSNNIDFAKKQIPADLKNVVYIQNEPHYIDLFILSKCHHNIVTNSSFGWWGAWLNQNPGKIVIAPSVWFNPTSGHPTQDIVPESWVKIEAKWGASNDAELD